MSLYRKYRPQSFSHLVGQDHIKETLLNEFKHGHPSHAYLFTGPRGTGKTSTARLIAKCLNCLVKNDEGEACEKCEFCQDITEGRLIDVIEIDAASNRGIDEIRDLREKIKFAPTRAQNKVYIIDEVHMLTKEAFNALLKTLEEPPPNVFFILCTTEVHKIPETIISRCQRFDFKRIDVKTIMTRLSYIAQKEGIVVEDGAMELIATYVQGGLRDAIALLEQMIFDGKLNVEHIKEHLGVAGHHTVSQLAVAFAEKDSPKALRLIQGVHNEGYDLATFERELLDFLRLQLLKAVENEDRTEIKRITNAIEIFLKMREAIRFPPLPQLPLELAVIRICGGSFAETQREVQPKKETPLATMMKSETAQAEAETETVEKLKDSLEKKAWDRETIRSHWATVLEMITPPSLRRSLTTASLGEIDHTSITIRFASKFHLEKVDLIENRSKIEAAFEKLFEKKPVVKCVLEKVDLGGERKPRTLKNGEMPRENSKNAVPQTLPEDLSAQALEIFGGEEL